MAAIPTLKGDPSERLAQIPGSMPRLDAIPSGCAFNPRCGYAFERCPRERPEPYRAGGSYASCFLHDAKVPPPEDITRKALAEGIEVAAAHQVSST
jgi:peptide/nickel transport system ATP-binding protein